MVMGWSKARIKKETRESQQRCKTSNRSERHVLGKSRTDGPHRKRWWGLWREVQLLLEKEVGRVVQWERENANSGVREDLHLEDELVGIKRGGVWGWGGGGGV